MFEHSTKVEPITKKAKLVSSTGTPDEASALVVNATPSPSTRAKIVSPSAAQQSYEIFAKGKAKVRTFSYGAGPVELGNAGCPQIARKTCPVCSSQSRWNDHGSNKHFFSQANDCKSNNYQGTATEIK